MQRTVGPEEGRFLTSDIMRGFFDSLSNVDIGADSSKGKREGEWHGNRAGDLGRVGKRES